MGDHPELACLAQRLLDDPSGVSAHLSRVPPVQRADQGIDADGKRSGGVGKGLEDGAPLQRGVGVVEFARQGGERIAVAVRLTHLPRPARHVQPCPEQRRPLTVRRVVQPRVDRRGRGEGEFTVVGGRCRFGKPGVDQPKVGEEFHDEGDALLLQAGHLGEPAQLAHPEGPAAQHRRRRCPECADQRGGMPDQFDRLAAGRGVDGGVREPFLRRRIVQGRSAEIGGGKWWLAAQELPDHRWQLNGLRVDAGEQTVGDEPGHRLVGIGVGCCVAAASESGPP